MIASQRRLLSLQLQPGDIIYITAKSWTSDLVQFGQSFRDRTWTHELTHVAFCGYGGMIYESTIGVHNLKLASGVKITPVSKWEKDNKPATWLFIQRIPAIYRTVEILDKAIAKANYLKSKKLFYPVLELVGTLIDGLAYSVAKLFKAKAWQHKILAAHNPFDAKNGMYCIAFVNHCFEAAGVRIIPDDVDESQCYVSDGVRGKQSSMLIPITPAELPPL